MATRESQTIESTAKIGDHPIHPMLVGFPIAFFTATLACDLAFWGTGNSFWAIAAMWALGAALVMGGLAAVFGLVDFLGNERIRTMPAARAHFYANATLIVLSLISFYLRYRYGAPAAIMPWGLAISFAVVGILLFSGWKGGDMVYEHRVGIKAISEARDGSPDQRRAA
jgi:uncharacterized membrane protein